VNYISAVAPFRKLLRVPLIMLIFSASIAAAAVGDLVDTTEVMSGIVDIDSTVVGEIHGTREIPLLFNRIVKDHLKAGFFVVVALEMPQSEIDGIRAAIQKKRFDKAQLAKSRFWSLAHDGRTSQAMLDLVKLLSVLPEAYRITLVVEKKYTRQIFVYAAQSASVAASLLCVFSRLSASVSVLKRMPNCRLISPLCGLTPSAATCR
jgi:hypothetical protein